MIRRRGRELRTRNPLMDDVSFGTGGIAGGRFTLDDPGTGDVNWSLYVRMGYIEGQPNYVVETV